MATSKNRKNAFYAQSGGVTAVINASACGVIETARAHRDVIANVYAAGTASSARSPRS
jgi:6-phosphofructokinase 1